MENTVDPSQYAVLSYLELKIMVQTQDRYYRSIQEHMAKKNKNKEKLARYSDKERGPETSLKLQYRQKNTLKVHQGKTE